MKKISWKSVKSYEGLYEINDLGEIRSLHKRNLHRIMPQRIDRAGYYTVRLSKRGKDSTLYVHRILAFAFTLNSHNKPFVNHINGNKLDNSVQNLEWVTHSENMKHAYALGLCKKKEQTPVIDICSNRVFPSIKKAADYYAIPYSTCKGYLNGKRKNITCLRYLRNGTAA